MLKMSVNIRVGVACTYVLCCDIGLCTEFCSRSQWSRGLRRRSATADVLRLWVRIPPGALMFVVSVVR